MDRTRRARLLLVVPLLAAGIALGASTPAAAAQNCTTPVAGGTIKGGIVVPTGARCYLSGVAVRGGVTVAPGAFFQANSGTEIRERSRRPSPRSSLSRNRSCTAR